MTARVACDASALVAVLLDSGPDGVWAARELTGTELVAPALLPFEVANVIRRHERSAQVSGDQAAQAYADAQALTVELWPFELLADRVWELRHNLSAYDASYVATAELAGATLVTLDAALAQAPGIRCRVAPR